MVIFHLEDDVRPDRANKAVFILIPQIHVLLDAGLEADGLECRNA